MIVGFSRPKKFNLISNLIRLWQGWTPYSHVFMVINFEGRQLVAEASHGDVHLLSMKNFYEKNEVVYTKNMTIDRSGLIDFIIQNLQNKYGFLTILKIMFGLKDGENDSYICSEFAAKAISDYLPKDMNLNTITPKQLYELLRE